MNQKSQPTSPTPGEVLTPQDVALLSKGDVLKPAPGYEVAFSLHANGESTVEDVDPVDDTITLLTPTGKIDYFGFATMPGLFVFVSRPASEQPVEAIGAGREEHSIGWVRAEIVGRDDSEQLGVSVWRLRAILAALSPASPARTPMGGEVEALREAENEICPHGDNVPADLEPGDTWVCPKCDAEWHTDDSQALATSSPSPAQGGEFDALEDWEHDDQRELSRLYRHRFDDSLQFNRGQMRTAIRHGRRIAALSASPQPEAGEASEDDRAQAWLLRHYRQKAEQAGFGSLAEMMHAAAPPSDQPVEGK